MTRLKRTYLAFALACAALAAPELADAFEGVVRGRIQFYNNQGNYCPSFRDCTDARYHQSEYNRVQPIRSAKVYVVDSGGNRIGQGSTTGSGRFTIRWSSSSAAPRAHIEWYGEHRDGRYAIRTSRGGRYVMWTANRTLIRNTTSSRPQELGNFVWGSASNPHSLANLYDGAWRMWTWSLSQSRRMRTYFTDVQVRAFDPVACPTSCANGKRIIIDSVGSTFSPQARIFHEMGHVASELSSPGRSYRFCGQYNRNGNPGWNMSSQEWACASFEEGLATFFGDVAVYGPRNPAPHSCISSSFCASATNVETTTGMLSCSTNEGRTAFAVSKYLRDLYDRTNVAESRVVDPDSVPYFHFFDTLNRYRTGTGNQAKNEPWRRRFFIWSIDDRDGRSSIDFSRHFRAQTGLDDGLQLLNNCATIGD